MEFGSLFCSKEGTVYEWEKGRSVPMLFKLINISAYFGVSLDCLVNGKTAGDNVLEARLVQPMRAEAFESVLAQGFGRVMSRFHTLPSHNKERLVGYLDALCRENAPLL